MRLAVRQELGCLAGQLSQRRWELALAIVIAATLADTVLAITGIIQPLNGALTRATYQVQPPWLELPMIALTYLGYGAPLFLIAIAIAAWATRSGHRRDAVLLLASGVVAQITVVVAKYGIAAPRPDIIAPPHLAEPLLSYGYPSGHALMSTVILGFAAIVIWNLVDRTPVRLAVLVATVLLIAGVGFSRVYLGVHWVNDVIGGYLYGGTILLLAYLLHRCDQSPHERDTRGPASS